MIITSVFWNSFKIKKMQRQGSSLLCKGTLHLYLKLNNSEMILWHTTPSSNILACNISHLYGVTDDIIWFLPDKK